MNDFIRSSCEELIQALRQTLLEDEKVVKEVAQQIHLAFASGRKLLFCGNGGSAADCQHLAAEFVNRFKIERRPLPAIALTTDTSILTAIANDYSFFEVFEKQLHALGAPGDVLVGISTSGRSENVLRALKVARQLKMVTVGLTGSGGDEMAALCDYLIRVRSGDTPRIQEVHIFVGHLICDLVERKILEK